MARENLEKRKFSGIKNPTSHDSFLETQQARPKLVYINGYPCARRPCLSHIGSSGGHAFLKHFGFQEHVIVFIKLDVAFQVTEKTVMVSDLFILDFAVRAKADTLEKINSLKLLVS